MVVCRIRFYKRRMVCSRTVLMINREDENGIKEDEEWKMRRGV